VPTIEILPTSFKSNVSEYTFDIETVFEAGQDEEKGANPNPANSSDYPYSFSSLLLHPLNHHTDEKTFTLVLD